MTLDRFVEIGWYSMSDGQGKLYLDRETREIFREVGYMHLVTLPEKYQDMLFDILLFYEPEYKQN